MARKSISRAPAVTAALIGGSASSAEMNNTQARVITSPERLPGAHDRPRVFLGGSIDMGSAPDWQRDLIDELKDEDVIVLNPRRKDWNPAWKPDADDPNFRQQVEWELGALESADIIVLYLAAGSKSPISLLEMGLYARSGKLIVFCSPAYWRKGNVDLTAKKYDIHQVDDLQSLVRKMRERLDRLRADQPSKH